jgi:hypothetical protein
LKSGCDFVAGISRNADRLLPDLKDGTSGSISQTSAHAQVLLPAIPINQMAYIVKLTSNS